MIKLDILSDPICPWCYIGKTLLFHALEQRPDHPFEIEWHPFQLNPDMPKGGMDRRDYLELKFGGKEKAVEVYARIAEAAEAAGLEIDFGAIQRTPNTLDAHRLTHWAGLEGRQTEVVQSLFDAYFLQGRDIGDRDVLADIADSAGLDAAVIRRLLEGDADAEDIRARDANARESGVTGVPTFIIGNQHVVPGAQQPDLWIRLVDEVNGQLGGTA
ncbi:DsbA family oxidoreductase [Aliiruegeria lutimaris]|uniref:Predicted dithiol-disulfide isomerase, DsbA family n=1 Tax=Aliiruegeria lutimaris TaxID=571298 RepID=A0A1G8KR83_9RHOB|nr:DsbA family oxidoreductase [Aliiruegeria lutimaris]SDI45938.1 Predicted dithiol-disulfide isomerase, DsbA family [Aliiruegeria lutimaris]